MNPSEKTPTSEVAAPRKRISWLAWAMTVLVACCLLVMNSRGELEPRVASVFILPANQNVPTYRYSHGWPMKWVESKYEDVTTSAVRATAFNSYRVANKPSSAEGWIFEVTPVSVDYFACVINLLVAASILAIVFFASRFRSRRQRGFRFSLLEVAAFMLLASIAMASYQHHRSLSKNETQLISDTEGSIQVSRYQWQCPAALRSLLGEPEWMNVFRHVDQFELNAHGLDESVAEKLGTFTYAKSVQIHGDPSLPQIEGLSGIQGLESIEVDNDIFFNRLVQ